MLNTTMDNVLYGRVKIGYLALQSLITNVTLCGTAFLLYTQGFVQPTLIGIAVLFGIGILVDIFVLGGYMIAI